MVYLDDTKVESTPLGLGNRGHCRGGGKAGSRVPPSLKDDDDYGSNGVIGDKPKSLDTSVNGRNVLEETFIHFITPRTTECGH